MTATPPFPQCAHRLRAAGKAYPRTCAECGLFGPCRDGLDPTLDATPPAPATDNKPQEWKCGDAFLPFHPSASHVPAEYRDGWNRCYDAALSVSLVPAAWAQEPIHRNHLPDLRYVLGVLKKVLTAYNTELKDSLYGDIQAAIIGMRYVINRTEEAAATKPPATVVEPQSVRDAILSALISVGHQIAAGEVRLFRDATKDTTALHQLCNSLEAAWIAVMTAGEGGTATAGVPGTDNIKENTNAR